LQCRVPASLRGQIGKGLLPDAGRIMAQEAAHGEQDLDDRLCRMIVPQVRGARHKVADQRDHRGQFLASEKGCRPENAIRRQQAITRTFPAPSASKARANAPTPNQVRP